MQMNNYTYCIVLIIILLVALYFLWRIGQPNIHIQLTQVDTTKSFNEKFKDLIVLLTEQTNTLRSDIPVLRRKISGKKISNNLKNQTTEFIISLNKSLSDFNNDLQSIEQRLSFEQKEKLQITLKNELNHYIHKWNQVTSPLTDTQVIYIGQP